MHRIGKSKDKDIVGVVSIFEKIFENVNEKDFPLEIINF